MKVKVSTVMVPEKTTLTMVNSPEVITVQERELETVVLAISARMPAQYPVAVQKGKSNVKLYQ